ncbi:hypothetical protein Tco_0053629 [Tanacetum coccineum]
MIDCLSIDETDKVIHNVETDIVKLMVEIESFAEKLRIRLNFEAANPVKTEKLRIRLNFEAANPVETEKLRIRLNFEAANSVETENLRIRLSL